MGFKHRFLAAIAYVPLPPLFLITLLYHDGGEDFMQFHGKQGLVLFVVWFILFILGFIPLVSLLVGIGYLALIVVAVIAFVRTLTGGRWEIPLVGRYAKRIRL